MKFLCPNCKAKYQIADEKVAGRTLRMDCRRCGNNVTIRADMAAEEVDVAPVSEPLKSTPPSARASATAAAPKRSTGAIAAAAPRTGGSNVGPAPLASASRAARPIGPPSGSALGADFRRNVSMAPDAPKRTPLDQWHVAINDVPVGPMRRDEITKKIAAGAITGESLCWREGFDDWRPLRDVTELAALMRRPATEMPKPAAPRSPGGLGARPLAPAARPVPTARTSIRSNVVPIGGRFGAVASLEPDFEEHEEAQDADEPTRVAGFDLQRFEEELAAKGKKPEAKVEAKAEPRAELKVDPKTLERAAKKSVPPPPPEPEAAPIELREPSKRPSAPFPARKDPTPAPRPAAKIGAPLPVVATSAFPAAVPLQPAARQQERRGGIPVGGWIAIAGAMAFGGVLAVMVGSRVLGEPSSPAVATNVPLVTAPTPVPAAPPVAEIVEPPAEAVVIPTTEVPVAEVPVTEAPTTPSGGSNARPHREGTTPAANPTPTTPAGATGRFAAFQDEASSTGPARIAVAPRATSTEDSVTGGQDELSADQLRAVIVRERPAVNRCWETELRRIGQAAEVRLDVDLTIGGSGTVTNVQTRGQTVGGLSECIERSVRRWRFPAVSGQTRTSFPLIFSGS